MQHKETVISYNLRFDKKLLDPNYSPKTPFLLIDYRSELDVSTEYDDDQTNYFQNLIGVLRWIVELGSINTAYEVSSLSKFLVRPRTGHIYQALHVFKYLEAHINNDKSFNPLYQKFNSHFDPQRLMNEMKGVYADAREEMPTNAPIPRGKSVQLNCFVDADHGGDSISRRSQTGIIEAKYSGVIYLWIGVCRITNCNRVNYFFSILIEDVWYSARWPRERFS